MEIDELPSTFEEYSPFKKTFKQCWLSLLAALMCFGSTGVNIYNTYRHILTNNYSDAPLCVIFALTTLALAIANVALFVKRYKKNKLNDSTF